MPKPVCFDVVEFVSAGAAFQEAATMPSNYQHVLVLLKDQFILETNRNNSQVEVVKETF